MILLKSIVYFCKKIQPLFHYSSGLFTFEWNQQSELMQQEANGTDKRLRVRYGLEPLTSCTIQAQFPSFHRLNHVQYVLVMSSCLSYGFQWGIIGFPRSSFRMMGRTQCIFGVRQDLNPRLLEKRAAKQTNGLQAEKSDRRGTIVLVNIIFLSL